MQSPVLNAGDLRHRLYFRYDSQGVDDDGFPMPIVTDYISAKAKLKTLKGRNFYMSAQENKENIREFTIRYRRELDDGRKPHGLFVVWKDKRHEIEFIENDNGLNATMTVLLKVVD